MLHPQGSHRRAAAAAEFAIVAPFIVFCFIVGIDFARVYYHSLVVTYCARDGAAYGCWSQSNAKDTAGIQSAATADNSAIAGINSSAVTVALDNNTSPTTVTVTVRYTFRTLANYVIPNAFNIPSTWVITRTCQMNVAPDVPS